LSSGKPPPIWYATVKKNSEIPNRALALLSGGLDSTVSLALATRYCQPVLALFFDYTQHASRREEEAARGIAENYGLAFTKVTLPWLGEISSSALIAGKGEVPEISASQLSTGTGASSRDVWIENRNGIFIHIAAAYAVEHDCRIVIVGFNREEAETFPDNSEQFLEAVNGSLELGVAKPVRVESPTVSMTKRDIVEVGLQLDIPWKLLWSCYRGGEEMCGRCESCQRLRRAVADTPAGRDICFGGEDR